MSSYFSFSFSWLTLVAVIFARRLSERIKLKFLPEMVYGDNVLSFTHMKSGTVLKLTAEDGLRSCADPPKDYLAVQVKAAKDWQDVTKYVRMLRRRSRLSTLSC